MRLTSVDFPNTIRHWSKKVSLGHLSNLLFSCLLVNLSSHAVVYKKYRTTIETSNKVHALPYINFDYDRAYH